MKVLLDGAGGKVPIRDVRFINLQLLAPFKVWQQFSPRPTSDPELCGPIVDIDSARSTIGHEVDTARAAQHFPTRDMENSIVGSFLY